MSENRAQQPQFDPILAHASNPTLQKALLCARAAIDKKAENLRVLDVSNVSGFTDYFIICSAMTDRQIQAIADSVEFQLKTFGHSALSVEGYSEGRWVLLDFGDVVVHVFLDAIREFYNLEGLWEDAPRVQVPSEFYGPSASRLN
ncbi:MAG: ribosome silencing factor [Bacteriovoracia bacterium]